MYEWTNEFEREKQQFEDAILKYDYKLEVLNSSKKVKNYNLSMSS